MEPEAASLLPIVVGAHLGAELSDRPLAYQLRQRMLEWLGGAGRGEEGIRPIVCCDLWYLNAEDLMLQPTVSIGDPEVNAASAYLAGRLPTALVVDERLRVQLDPEFVDQKVCIWGVDAASTARGLDLFTDRYLNAYLRSVHDLPPAGP